MSDERRVEIKTIVRDVFAHGTWHGAKFAVAAMLIAATAGLTPSLPKWYAFLTSVACAIGWLTVQYLLYRENRITK